jgi:hypothetical protein
MCHHSGQLSSSSNSSSSHQPCMFRQVRVPGLLNPTTRSSSSSSSSSRHPGRCQGQAASQLDSNPTTAGCQGRTHQRLQPQAPPPTTSQLQPLPRRWTKMRH